MPDSNEIRILHAGNISKLMSMVADELLKRDPCIRVAREKGGSVDIVKKISLQNDPADIIATADYHNIKDFLFEKYADWCVTFATTSMVLAYTDMSRFSGMVSTENWYQVLSTPGVRIKWGNPNVDPGAYRRIMIGKLAEKYYGQPGLADKIEANVVKPDKDKVSHAIPMAKSGNIDYAFMYRPAAAASGLRFLELPPQVNLSDPEYIDFYRSVEVISSGIPVKGDVIGYGITVPKNAMHPELALQFIALLLGPAGTRMMRECGFEPIQPFKAIDNVPSMLCDRCETKPCDPAQDTLPSNTCDPNVRKL